jgi:hypothetical protein
MDLNDSFSPQWTEMNFSSEYNMTDMTAEEYTHQASVRIVLLSGKGVHKEYLYM